MRRMIGVIIIAIEVWENVLFTLSLTHIYGIRALYTEKAVNIVVLLLTEIHIRTYLQPDMGLYAHSVSMGIL